MPLNKNYRLPVLKDTQDRVTQAEEYIHPHYLDLFGGNLHMRCLGRYRKVKATYEDSGGVIPTNAVVAGDTDPSICYQLLGSETDPETETYDASGLSTNWKMINAPLRFVDLTDTPSTLGGGGKRLVMNDAGTGVTFEDNTFLLLDDVPNTFASPNDMLRVNSTGTGLEFFSAITLTHVGL